MVIDFVTNAVSSASYRSNRCVSGSGKRVEHRVANEAERIAIDAVVPVR